MSEIKDIKQVDDEFEAWYEKNKREFIYFPYFFTGDGCDFALPVSFDSLGDRCVDRDPQFLFA